MVKKNKISGTCQGCFGSYALTAAQLLVHHGYTRPGYGYIVGDCVGVNALPYELSCEVTKKWHAEIETAILPRQEARRVELDTVTELTCSVTDWVTVHAKHLSRTPYPIVLVTFRKGEEVTDRNAKSYASSFEGVQKAKIRDIERDIEQSRRTLVELARRIKAWVYAPEKLVNRSAIPTVVHSPGYRPGDAACRRRGFRSNVGFNTSTDAGKVNCPKCLAKKATA